MEKIENLFQSGAYESVLTETAHSTNFEELCLRARAYAITENFDSALQVYEAAVQLKKDDVAECIGIKISLLEDIGKAAEDIYSSGLELTGTLAETDAQAAFDNFTSTTSVLPQFSSVWNRLCKPFDSMDDFMGLGKLAGQPIFWQTCDHFAEISLTFGQNMILKFIHLSQKKDATAPRYSVYGMLALDRAYNLFSVKNEKNEETRGPNCKQLIAILRKVLNATVSPDGGGDLLFAYGDSLRKTAIDLLKNAIQTMRSIDFNYVAPPIPPLYNPYSSAQQQSGGCYVATAVYGSYDCPEVWTLRRYRDQKLAETWYGRAFIRTYYAISPTLVKWFGDTRWFKNMWRGKLDRMVKNPQEQGYDSQPYEDQPW